MSCSTSCSASLTTASYDSEQVTSISNQESWQVHKPRDTLCSDVTLLFGDITSENLIHHVVEYLQMQNYKKI